MSALERGDIDLTSFSDVEPVEVERLRQNPSLKITQEGYEYFSPLEWIEINHRVKPLDDKRFRQAMMYSIDRDFIADAICFGTARPATGPIATDVVYEPNVTHYPYDPRKAEALLDEMGLKKDSSGVRPSFGSSSRPTAHRSTAFTARPPSRRRAPR